MKRTSPRFLRGALLALLAGVTIAVGFTLRKPHPPAPPPSNPMQQAGAGTTAGELVYRNIVDGKERYVVKAKAMLGQEREGTRLQEVEASFPHVHEGQEQKTVITAQDCVYDAERQRATFTGHVKVVTTEGLELATESLVYNGVKSQARSDEHVDFRRGRASGSATGMLYQGVGGDLTLEKDVVLRFEREDGRPPTEVRADSGSASRSEAIIRLQGNVVITEGADQIQSQKATFNLTPDLQYVYRAVFVDDTELRTGARGKNPSGTDSPASSFSGDAPRVLKSRKLDVWFYENSRELREAVAVPDASLVIGPGPGGERHSVSARVLTFRFDPEGQLREILAQQDVQLVTIPPAGKPGARTVKCAQMVSTTDPATGGIAGSEFTGGVEIVEGARKATAQSARFEDASRSLFLQGAARVVDPDQGSDLSAGAIDLLGNGNLAARESVRHEMTPRGKAAPSSGLAANRQSPWLVQSRFLDYDASTRAGRYKENALLRSGDDEVRSDLLILEEPKPGQRRLRGQGSVVSLLHARKTDADGKEKAKRDPVETRSGELDYEEAKRQVVYTGDVRIRQADITTRSPQATAYLSSDGTRVETIVAGEPVEVQQGVRQAKGTTGTYTVATETLHLVGEKVVLDEGTRQHLQGRSLTFHARDDTILVDGREVERTESVFRREPPRP